MASEPRAGEGAEEALCRAGSDGAGMPGSVQFSTTRLVHASNTKVWSIIGDFGNEHTWVKGMKHCARDTPDVRVGTTRTCELAKPLMGVTHAVETLTEFEPGHVLAYRLHGDAGPFAKAQSRWSTRSMPDGTTALTVEGRFEPKNWASRYLVWPIAKPMIVRLTQRTIGELETHVNG